MNYLQVLKQYFGYDEFREGQEDLIKGILEGKDVFGIMPTGSGKSLCFQVPALMMSGITLVISPLISLMKDQVYTLNQAGIHAAFLNSSLTTNQYYKALSFAKEGRYKIIYVAPERLESDVFLDFVNQVEISMVAVDEAHCVSQWGQDFRPSYLKIMQFVNKLRNRPVISAFTATATKTVQEDIIEILNLNNPVLVKTGYDRPNLHLSVQMPTNKYLALSNYVENRKDRSGIIYCLTRKSVEEVSAKLIKDGYRVARYHAGLSDEERIGSQEDFIYDRVPIMVATNAFGMGIDKSNIRYVVHYNMPKSIEAFYQEIGRCSRDQEPGECVLFYSGQDVVTNQFFIENNRDNDALDADTRVLVQKQEQERLRKMTFYCFTTDCFRDYILRYFGEAPTSYCGNCENCMTKFEEVNVTQEAIAIINCIEESRQRYGINIILDTLRGGKTAKIRNYNMDQLSSYASLSKHTIHRLRKIANELIYRELIRVTTDEYGIVKLTDLARELVRSDGEVFMKLSLEQEKSSGQSKKKETKSSASLSVEDNSLFDQLRSLRLEIAKQEKVPPYIVFSDKTLVSMCAIKPTNKEEMLTVSGVGEYKYEKYGIQFLEITKKA